MFKIKLFLMGLVLSFFIVGCSFQQVKDSGKAVAGGTYLYYEYNTLVSSIKSLPLTDEERSILRTIDSEINEIRLNIGALYQSGGAKAVVGLLEAKNIMTKLGSAFARGEAVIKNHFKRRKEPLPRQYQFYAAQAYMTYQLVVSAIQRANNEIPLEIIGFYLKAGIQTLVAAKLGPVGGAAARALMNQKKEKWI